tara:strand:- start:185 stop:445 length:261 start_codon:yes stop_codon:yes gene_type:complete
MGKIKIVKRLLYDAMEEADRVKLLTLYSKGMDLPAGSPAHKKVMKEIDELRSKQPHLESVQPKPKKMFTGGLAKKGYGKAYLKGKR